MVKVRNLVPNNKEFSVTFLLNDDSETTLMTTEDLVVEYRLVPGKILDDFAFLSFQKAHNNNVFYQKAFSYGARYPQSRWEMKEYLLKKNCPETEIAGILSRLEKKHIIDDSRYVSLYLEDHVKNRLEGPVKVSFDLKQKGIAKALIEQELSSITPKELNDGLESLFDKKLSSFARSSKRKAMNDMIRFLTNKGYDLEMVRHFVEQKSDCFSNDRDEDLLLKKEIQKCFSHLHIEGKPTQEQSVKIIRQLLGKGFAYPSIKKQLERGLNDETEDVGI